MSNDREFRVKIKTEADTAPLQGLTDKTKAYIAELKQGTADAGKFELKHRELREIIGHISREAPELGLIARYALNPWVASIGAAIYGLTQLSEHYKAMAEIIRSRIDVKPLQELLDLVGPQGIVKAFDDAGFAADDFIHQLGKIAEAQQTVKGATDDTIGSIHAFIDAVKQQKAAEAERDLARVHADVATGKITDAQGIIAENSIRVRHGDMDRTLAGQTEEKIIAAKQAERAQLADQLQNAPGAHVAETHLASLKVNADSAKAAADAAQKQEDAAKEHYLKNGLHPGEESGMDFNRFKIAQHQNEKAQTGADEAAHTYDEAKKANEELQKGLLETANQLKALDEEIPKLIQSHAAAQESRQIIGQTQHETASLDTITRLAGTREGGYVEKAAGIQQALDAHKAISQGDAEFYKQFLAIMQTSGATKGQSQAQIIQALEAVGGTQSTLTQKCEWLARESAALQERLQYLGINGPP